MPVLAVGKPFTSAEPTLLVENALKAGIARFQLNVVDAAGNVSAPALLTVTVREQTTINPNILRGLVREPAKPVITPIRPLRPGG